MKKVKRILAATLCLLLAISLVSCGRQERYVMEVGGDQIPVGLYIYYLVSVNGEAMEKVDEQMTIEAEDPEVKESETEADTTEPTAETEAPEDNDEDEKSKDKDDKNKKDKDKKATTEPTTDSTTEAATEGTVAPTTETTTINYRKQTIDSKPFAKWVEDEALLRVKRQIATEALFEELGLVLTEKELSDLPAEVDRFWEQYGQAYENLGVIKTSYRRYLEGAYKTKAVMNHYYGVGGPEGYTQNELLDMVNKSYATAFVITQQKWGYDAEDNYGEYTDELLDLIREAGLDYAERLKDEDYETVVADYNRFFDTALGKDPAPADEDEDDEETTTESTTESTTEEAEAESEEPEMAATPNITLTWIENTETAYVEELFDTKKGESGFAETDTAIYMFVRTNDIESNPYYLDGLSTELFKKEKGDDFNKKLDAKITSLSIKINQAALDKYNLDFIESQK